VRNAGARAVLDKALPAAELARAVIAIAAGQVETMERPSPAYREAAWPGQRFGLTVRESEVASLLLQGLSNREIARTLYVSEHTVKTHLKGIFNKTDTRSRGQAVARIAAHRDFHRSAT
jgi:DNA-binding NarL/FixJ family response regulator